MDIKESATDQLKRIIEQYIDDAKTEGLDIVELKMVHAEFLLSTIKSLTAERDKYREALDELGYDDGFIICPNCGRVKANE